MPTKRKSYSQNNDSNNNHERKLIAKWKYYVLAGTLLIHIRGGRETDIEHRIQKRFRFSMRDDGRSRAERNSNEMKPWSTYIFICIKWAGKPNWHSWSHISSIYGMKQTTRKKCISIGFVRLRH